MKKNFKRWLALLLAVAMVATSAVYSSGTSLKATGDPENVEQSDQQSEPQTGDEGTGSADAAAPDSDAGTQETGETESKQVIELEKPQGDQGTSDQEAQNPEQKEKEEVTPEQGGEQEQTGDMQEEPTPQKFSVVFHKPAVEGGSLKVWEDGSDKKDATYDGEEKYTEEITEGALLNFEITVDEKYSIEKVTDQNGAEIAPVSAEGNIFTYQMSVSENKEINILYKEVSQNKEEPTPSEDKKEETENTAGEANNEDAEHTEMPAANFEGSASNGLNVTATVDEGVFPAGTTMKVTSVSDSKAESLLEEALDDNQKVVSAQAVDIIFQDADGNEIQPADGGIVNVSITGASVAGDEIAVYHVDEAENVEKVAEAASTGAEFAAEAFSIYVVGGYTDAGRYEYYRYELKVGESVEVYTSSSSKNKSWNSSNTAVAAVTKLSGNNGRYAQITAKGVGKATITYNNSSYEKFYVEVTQNNVKVTSITISGNNTVNVGESTTLTATVRPNDAANKNVTWKSSNTGVATVNSSGRVTGVNVGTAKITATAADGSGVKDEFTIQVGRAVSSQTAYFYIQRPEQDPGNLKDDAWLYVGTGSIDTAGLNLQAGKGQFALNIADRILSYPNEATIKSRIAALYGVDVSAVAIEYSPYKITYPMGWVDENGTGHDGGRACYHVDMTVSITTKEKASATYHLWDYNSTGFTPVESSMVYIGETTSPKSGNYPATKKDAYGNVYTFDGWYTNAGLTGEKVVFPYTVNSAVNFYAKYVPKNTFKVTYDGNGNTGGTVPTDAASYLSGNQVTIKRGTPEKNGYTFEGWEYDGDVYTQGQTFTMPASSVILKAKWAPKSDVGYTVHYYLQGSAVKVRDDKVVDGQTFDSEVTENAVNITGYTAVAPTEKTIKLDAYDKEIAFYYTANKDVSYTVHYYLQDTENSLAPDKTVDNQEFNKVITETAKTIQGYDLVGDKTQTFRLDEYNKEIVFYYTAGTETPYQIEYYQQNVNNDDYTRVETVRKTGTTGTIAAAEEKSYTGFKLNKDAADTVAEGTIAADGSLILKLFYDRNQYKVTYEYTGTVPEGATALPEEATYKFGAQVTVAEAASAPGYTFSGWNKNGTFTMPAEDVLIQGSFTANTNTEYIVQHYWQNIDNDEYTLHETENLTGTTGVEVTAEPKSYTGFTFDNTVDGTVEKGTVRGDGKLELRLYYTRNSYPVEYSYVYKVPDGASELPAKASYKYGATVKTAEAATAPGYTFRGWDKEAEFIMPAGPVYIHGYFTADTDTKYTVIHYKEKLEGKYEVADTENLTGVTDEEALAIAKSYPGFTWDPEVAGTKVTGIIEADGTLELRLYYNRNIHAVTYGYEGVVPDGASDLPASRDYKFGEVVNIAGPASAPGYDFSGWSLTEGFTMPDKNVEIKGHFTARNDTIYTVEHYLQDLDGNSYTREEAKEWTGITGATATAKPNTYKGFTFDGSVEGTVQTGTITGDGKLVLKLFYTRNSHTVTYNYEGKVPTGATALPSAETYKYGEQVKVADAATAPDYIFSGWNKSDFAMPDEDVEITGSWSRDFRTISVAPYHEIYDGESHGVTVTGTVEGDMIEYSTDGENFDSEELLYKDVVKDDKGEATSYPVYVRVKNGDEYSSIMESYVKITPATLTVQTNNGWKVYDGEPLVGTGSISGFVKGEEAEFIVTGQLTEVDKVPNTYEIKWEGATARADNYIIDPTLGELEVVHNTQKITVTTKGDTYTYDGTEHGAEVTVSTPLPKGYKVEKAVSNASVKDVTTEPVEVTCDELIIVNAAGKDVTKSLNIEYVNGTITVNPTTLYVTTFSDNKVYDGTALEGDGEITGFVKGETAEFKVTGSQTKVGHSPNTYTIEWNGSAKQSNYVIDPSIGTLHVREYAGEIVVTTKGGTHEYTGKPYGAEVTVSDLPLGYHLKEAKSNATATHVADGPVEAGCDKLVIENADGEDVTGNLTIKYVNDTIVITPATLDIVTYTDQKTYDGTALIGDGEIKGLVNGETVGFKVTGSQTKVGTSDNGYDLKWNGTAVETDYTIHESIGKLTVSESQEEIVVTTTGGTYTYTGEPHGAKVTVSDLPEGYTVETAESSAAVIDVTAEPVVATCDNLVIRNAEGEDVTAGLNIKYVDGQITVEPAILTIVTESAKREYNGKPLTADGSITGFVHGEDATFTVTGSITEVGTTKNLYELVWDGSAKESNYTIDDTIGDLTIVESTAEIVVTTTGGEFTYTGIPHKATVSVSTLPEGYKLITAKSNDSAKDVTTEAVEADCDTLVIHNAEGKDVTEKLKIKYINGKITVKPAVLKVVTQSATKEYDGTPLTADGEMTGLVNNETAALIVTGSQTKVGKSDNTYKIDWNGSARESNYEIQETIGKLIVDESTAEILVTTTGGDFIYTGEPHGAEVTVSNLPKGYRVVTAESSASATNVTKEAVTATCDKLVIYNAEGEDVTDKLNIKLVDGEINVEPATLKVVTNKADKPYDGTPLTADGTITGFVKGETATLKTTGAQTKVGYSDNTYEIIWDGTADKDNYKIEESLGVLEVYENTSEIVVTTKGDTYTYTGTPHGATVEVSELPTGYELESAVSNAAVTDVTEEPVKAGCDKLVIRNASGDDVTENLNITYIDGEIIVVPATLSVVTESDDKVYDGEPLTAPGTIEGFVNNETAEFRVTGSQTAVGNSLNGFEIIWNKTAKESNYTIEKELGTLLVKEYEDSIVVTTTGGSFTYTGKPHKATVTVSDLPQGYTLETAESSASVTDVADGTVTATCDKLVIRNKQGEDVTKQLKIQYVNDDIKVTPAKLTVKTESANGVYNGQPLTAEGSIEGFVNDETADFQVTGSQTKVGHSLNTYEINWNDTAKKDNYEIKEDIGLLTVSEYKEEIVVTTTGGSFPYTGKAHGATVSVSDLPDGYELEKAESSASATDVTSEAVTASCDTLIIRNAQGEDVTERLKIRYENGSITVTPAKLTVVTQTANKVYNGTPLTAGGSIDGFVEGETATFTVTGSQTEVGYSPNTYHIEWDKTAKAKNYEIDESVGELTVTENKAEIVVTTQGGTFTYTGTEHTADVTVSDLPDGYELEKAESSASVTDVTDSPVSATCDTLIIRNKQGVDVTSRLNISYVDGEIIVEPAVLTVKTERAERVYNGEPLTAGGTIEGFVNNETADFQVTGSQTEVGVSDNTYVINWNGTAKEKNYKINETVEKLIVKENAEQIVVTVTGGTFTYTGSPHKATVSVSDLPDGYTLETAESSAAVTDVEDGTVTATCDTLVIRNAQGEDVTDKLNIIIVTDTIAVAPAELIVVTDGAEKVYDAKPLTAGGTINGLINEETATLKLTGSQTNAGTSDNTYEIVWDGTAKQSNYIVNAAESQIGVLDVQKRPILITAASADKTYDGTALVKAVSTAGLGQLLPLHTYTANVEGSQTYVGTSDNIVKDAEIVTLLGRDDVTPNYAISYAKGKLTVTDQSVDVDDVVTKTHDDNKTYKLGDTVTFDISVKNIYDEAKTITIIEQDGVTITGNDVFEDVAPGEVVTTTATYTVTEEDILNGSFTNTVTAKFSDENKDYEKDDTVDKFEDPAGHLTVTKETTSKPANGKTYALGETIIYKVVAVNDGNLTLNSVVVTDELTGDEWTVGTLQPGQSSEAFKAEYTVTEEDILKGTVLNEATAAGKSTDPENPNPEIVPGNTEDPTDHPNGHLTVTKETTSTPANGEAYALGETITYKITAANDGNLTLKNVVVTDELTGDEWTIDSLAPGQSSEAFTASHKVTQKDILNGSVVNEATAAGKSPDPDKPDPGVEPGETEDPTVDPNGHLTVTKETTSTPENGAAYALGETITYKVTATNDGNLTLKNVVVTDELTGDKWTIESLKPGESSEAFTAEYKVTEQDILKGSVLNVATAKGESPDPDKPDPGVDPGEKEDPTETQQPSLFIEKIAAPAPNGGYALGDTIPYTIKVVNNGNVTISDITVTDDLTGNQWTIGSLEPNAEKSYSTEYVVTEKDIMAGKVVNVAAAEGTAPDESKVGKEDTETTVTENSNPHLSVSKETTSKPANGEAYALGETITYKITAVNDGNLTLKNIVITDELTGDEWTIDTLVPGQSSEAFTARHKVTEKDILKGSVLNEAAASAESPDPENPDPGIVPGETEDPTVDPAGHLTVSKETTSTPANGAAYDLGETITYKIIAANDGNLTLNHVVVTDELTGDEWTVGTLAPGQSSEVFTASYKVTEQDILNGRVLNVATAAGESPDPENPEPGVDPGEKEDPTASQQPSLFVEKTAAVKESGAYGLGDTIPYMIKVVNNGNVTVTDITVTDDLTGNEWTIDQLEPGAYEEYQAEYTVTEADVMAGKVVNVATAEGTDPEGEKVSKEDTETVETEISNPHLTVVKETTSAPANGESYVLGETISYKVVVTNDGNLTLKNVVVTDELTGDEWTIDSLKPGESSEAFNASHKVTQKDILKGSVVNEATAAGESPDPDKPDPGVDPGETEDPTDNPNAHLTVTKETTSTPENGAAYALGETITYKIVAANDGNLTLENVVVTDDLTGDEWTIDSLKPGESSEVFTAEYKVTEQDILNGTVLNVATAKGDSPDPEKPDPGVDPGEKEDPTVTPQPSLFVEKTAAAGPEGGFSLGDTVPYTIKVVNNGNVTISGITVNDDLTGGQWTIDSLEPNGTQEFTTDYVVTEADILAGQVVNVAAAGGTAPDGSEVTGEGTETIVTESSTPHLSISKETTSTPANGETYALGETITYSIVATNDGNLTLTNVVVRDELTGDEWTIDSLAPGASSETFTAEHTVTSADILNGSVLNVATAGGETPDPDKPDPGVDPGEKEDPTVDPNPSVAVVKEVTSTPADGEAYALGETISYRITVTNDGNIPVENIRVEDSLVSITENIITSLAPGESREFTYEYTVTEADIRNGQVVNTAAASTDDPEGPKGSDEVVTPTEPADAAYTVNKSVVEPQDEYRVGDTIQYQIAVSNTGNVTLHNVVVSDNLQGASGSVTFTNAGDYTVEGNKAIINEIGIGETIVLNCEYLIVREDAGASISNIASVRTDETGETPREDETEETPVVNIYRLTIHYVDAAGTAVAPDYTGEYEVGAAFSIESPAVTGYTPNYATVNSGADGMPAADVEVTVTYTANPVIVPIVPPVTPTTPATPATPAAPVTPVTPAAVTPTTPTAIIPPTPTPAAPIDAELTENDEGDYDLTPIQDEETPLAKQNLDDHVCCILHFLLMLLALIVLAFYTRSMKKRQARIFELREELELEMARRGLGEEEKEDDAE